MTEFLTTVLWFLVALCTLVAVHEYGHFYVARRCGVKVLRFSIGFGARIFSWRGKSGTEYALSIIPLGGYVKMLDEREGPVADSERALAYNQKTVGQRIAIAAAGPLANFALAAVLYWVLFAQGTSDLSPVIGSVKPGSIAAQAGLEAGQEIVSIDGQVTASRRAVGLHLLNRLGESGSISFTVKYPDSDLVYESRALLQDWLKGVDSPDPIQGLGFEYYYPPIKRIVTLVVPDGPASAAGIRVNDEIHAVNGTTMASWREWVDVVQRHPGQEITVSVLRDSERIDLRVTPKPHKTRSGETIGKVGVAGQVDPFPETMIRRYEYGLGGALLKGFTETWETSGFVLLSLKKLILGEISTKNLSGPIGIAKVAADHARDGIWAFVSLLAHLSVVLGVLNLLPIPVLDGGHILFCLAEWFKGRPLSERSQELGYKLGAVMILSVMMLAFYNDILRL